MYLWTPLGIHISLISWPPVIIYYSIFPIDIGILPHNYFCINILNHTYEINQNNASSLPALQED